MDFANVDWKREAQGFAFAVILAVVPVVGLALYNIETVQQFQAYDWGLLALTVGRSALSAGLAALGFTIPGVSHVKAPAPPVPHTS